MRTYCVYGSTEGSGRVANTVEVSQGRCPSEEVDFRVKDHSFFLHFVIYHRDHGCVTENSKVCFIPAQTEQGWTPWKGTRDRKTQSWEDPELFNEAGDLLQAVPALSANLHSL